MNGVKKILSFGTWPYSRKGFLAFNSVRASILFYEM